MKSLPIEEGVDFVQRSAEHDVQPISTELRCSVLPAAQQTSEQLLRILIEGRSLLDFSDEGYCPRCELQLQAKNTVPINSDDFAASVPTELSQQSSLIPGR